MSLIFAFLLTAHAGELFWLDDAPTPAEVAQLAVLTGDTSSAQAPIALRAAGTDDAAAEANAWAALATALRDVRPFETRLDGELVIQRELERPIQGIQVLRSDADRERLFAALAYQGFAVDRFFDDTLGQDDRAEPYRVPSATGAALPRPWVDAVALEPDRNPTPYEIAEAPQRARYAVVQGAAKKLIPGLLILEGPLPAGATLVLDGRPTKPGPSGQVRVAPGRHFLHVELDGRVLARATPRVGPADEVRFTVPLSDAAWQAWLDAARAGDEPRPPEPVARGIEALGGEVILAWRGKRGVEALRVTPSAAAPIESPKQRVSASPTHSGGARPQLALGLGGGWMSSGDFYLQDPLNTPRNRATVNSGTLDAVIEGGVEAGLFRASAIATISGTTGAHAIARTGDLSLRLRPDLGVAVGVRWAQLTGGYLFPHHPTVGVRATIPLWRGLEFIAATSMGFPLEQTRSDGTSWQGQRIYRAWGGLGWRFGAAP